jgi:hypothetical protein
MADQDFRRAREEPAPSADRRQFYHGVVRWTVGERPARAFDLPRTPALVFESDDAIRRVRLFPANWRDLDDAALYELSWCR